MLTMEWADYMQLVHSARTHDVPQSLELLRIVRRWFADWSTFADFSSPQRKAVAGILGKYEKTSNDLNHDWGWFGSMRGAGDFAKLIRINDRFLARAVDGIPRSGEVTYAQYKRFCASFLQAMKRPDTFLCVCEPNIAGAADALGFARTTLDLDNYWARVVEPIRQSTWHNADKPDGADGELWEARAAMLDALFYLP